MLMFLRAAATAILVAPVVIAVSLEPAFAQDTATAGTVIALSVAELVLGALATIAVPLVLAIWALIKARAAQTEAEWDDWVVARVEKLVREVIKDASARLPAEPPAALDLRGRIGNGGAS